MHREAIERLADEELMPLVGRKEAAAFEVFYDRHGGAADSLAYRIVGDATSAEDVTQGAFLSIWRSRARYDARRDPSARGGGCRGSRFRDPRSPRSRPPR